MTQSVIAGIALLAIGTFAMRFAGYKLGERMPLSERARTLLADAAILLLLAVAATSTFYEAGRFAGYARLTGVVVALLLAWRKAPLIVVIIAAAVATAGMRYAGIA